MMPALDRQILAVAEKFPVASSAANAGVSGWAFWESMMQRGTTVLTFAVAVGGAVMFVYNLRAARRKRRILRNLPCAQCGYRGRAR